MCGCVVGTRPAPQAHWAAQLSTKCPIDQPLPRLGIPTAHRLQRRGKRRSAGAANAQTDLATRLLSLL